MVASLIILTAPRCRPRHKLENLFDYETLGKMKDVPGSCSFSLVQYSKPKVIFLEIGTSQGTYNVRRMNWPVLKKNIFSISMRSN